MIDVLDVFEIEKAENGKSCGNCTHRKKGPGDADICGHHLLTRAWIFLNKENDCCTFWEEKKEKNEDRSS